MGTPVGLVVGEVVVLTVGPLTQYARPTSMFVPGAILQNLQTS